MKGNKEIVRIKVSNGQKLITKAKEYKNSGGEWKLQEKYAEAIGLRKPPKLDQLNWGIIISNNEKIIDICSLGEGEFAVNNSALDEVENYDQLCQLFPEAANVLIMSGNSKKTHLQGFPYLLKLELNTFKEMKDVKGKEYDLFRCLIAENFWHLKQILNEYIQENKDKISNSSHHFSNWVEIVDGQDDNMHLFVGEKNKRDGREIKIVIVKSEFERCSQDKASYDSLEEYWNLKTANNSKSENNRELIQNPPYESITLNNLQKNSSMPYNKLVISFILGILTVALGSVSVYTLRNCKKTKIN